MFYGGREKTERDCPTEEKKKELDEETRRRQNRKEDNEVILPDPHLNKN